MDFLIHREEGGGWFSIRFSSFLLSSVKYLNCRSCKRLREFERNRNLKAKL